MSAESSALLSVTVHSLDLPLELSVSDPVLSLRLSNCHTPWLNAPRRLSPAGATAGAAAQGRGAGDGALDPAPQALGLPPVQVLGAPGAVLPPARPALRSVRSAEGRRAAQPARSGVPAPVGRQQQQRAAALPVSLPKDGRRSRLRHARSRDRARPRGVLPLQLPLPLPAVQLPAGPVHLPDRLPRECCFTQWRGAVLRLGLLLGSKPPGADRRWPSAGASSDGLSGSASGADRPARGRNPDRAKPCCAANRPRCLAPSMQRGACGRGCRGGRPRAGGLGRPRLPQPVVSCSSGAVAFAGRRPPRHPAPRRACQPGPGQRWKPSEAPCSRRRRRLGPGCRPPPLPP